MRTVRYPKKVKARKTHRCSFCNEKIMSGIKYIKSTHIYDGQIYDWKSHECCDELVYKLGMHEEYDEGVTMEDFQEIVSHKHDDILIDQIPQDKVKEYGDIIRQLMRVAFKSKLDFVIRHVSKIN